jgi:hypothetical protein
LHPPLLRHIYDQPDGGDGTDSEGAGKAELSEK